MRNSGPESGFEERFEVGEALAGLLSGEATPETFESYKLSEILDVAMSRLIEGGIELDPVSRQRLRNLIQGITTMLSRQNTYASPVRFHERYRVNLSGSSEVVYLDPVTIRGGGTSIPYDVTQHVDTRNVQSVTSVLHMLSSQDREVILNVQLYILSMRDNNDPVLILRIMDRYVSQRYRGAGVGDQLLKIVDDIARSVNCSRISGQLVPEDPADMEALRRGHAKRGYTIKECEGAVFAEKAL